jgi:hypothetical protein
MSEHQLIGVSPREDIAGANWHEVHCSCGWVRKYPSRIGASSCMSSTSDEKRRSRWNGRRRDSVEGRFFGAGSLRDPVAAPVCVGPDFAIGGVVREGD